MLKTRQPQSISRIMKNNNLQQKSMRISQLNSLLQSILKQHNIIDCRIGNVKNGRLILEVPAAMWKLRIQFMQNEILRILRSKEPSIIQMKIIVNPRLATNTQKIKQINIKSIKKTYLMPKDIAKAFLLLAENADPTLKKALRSLAQYAQK